MKIYINWKFSVLFFQTKIFLQMFQMKTESARSAFLPVYLQCGNPQRPIRTSDTVWWNLLVALCATLKQHSWLVHGGPITIYRLANPPEIPPAPLLVMPFPSLHSLRWIHVPKAELHPKGEDAQLTCIHQKGALLYINAACPLCCWLLIPLPPSMIPTPVFNM